MARARDRISLVKAAYAPAPTPKAWLEGLAEAGKGALSGVVGAYAFRYDGLMAEAGSADRVACADVPRATLEAIMGFRAAYPDARDAGSFQMPPVESASEALARAAAAVGMDAGAAFAIAQQVMAPLGIADMVGINALAPSGGGCYVAILLAEPARLSPPLRRSLTRIASHLVAGLRLRRWEEPASGPEAVLDPRGRVVHAEGDARAPAARRALEQAAASIHTARGPLRRRSVDDAVEIWRALVAGRWSLLDHVDADGKRYLLARRNAPQISDPTALSEPERQVAALVAAGRTNKLVAYELGIAESTVSTHLSAALAKLRLGSRTELVRLLRPLLQRPDAAGAS